jgi:hypothetical protein
MITVCELDLAGFLDNSRTNTLVKGHNEEAIQILEEGKGTTLEWKQILLTSPFF